jgi:predicted O-methyltransferase YrrM
MKIRRAGGKRSLSGEAAFDSRGIAGTTLPIEAKFEGRVFNSLLRERPCFHGREGGRDYAISEKALSYLLETVQPDWRTLEIGTGYSTVIFASKSAEHTVISPLEEEHARIKQWGGLHGLSLNNVRFLAGDSERLLPSLQTEPLDLILIDGWHSFPSPFINWYFTASLLKVGGILVLDDTQLRTYHILSQFLLSEKGRWKLETRLTNLRGASDAVVFRKLAPKIHLHFTHQPWMSQPVGFRGYWWLFNKVRKRLVPGAN